MIRSLWVWSASGVLFLVWLPLMAAVRLFDRDSLHRKSGRCIRVLGRLFTRVYPGRILVAGLEQIDPRQAYVMVANHQSLADGPLTAHVPIDNKAVFRINLFHVPVVGWLLRMAGEIPVDRSDPRRAAKALLECGRSLRAGCSVLIFPEGTRSRDGQLLPFNDTPFRLALREGLPVLPVVLDGASAALPKNSWMFHSGGDIHVNVLAPVFTEGWGRKESAELNDHVWGLFADELKRIRKVSG